MPSHVNESRAFYRRRIHRRRSQYRRRAARDRTTSSSIFRGRRQTQTQTTTTTMENERMLQPTPPPTSIENILPTPPVTPSPSRGGAFGTTLPFFYSPGRSSFFSSSSPPLPEIYTNTECVMCLEALDSMKENIVQCKVCIQGFHHECLLRWRTAWSLIARFDELQERKYVPCPHCKESKGYLTVTSGSSHEKCCCPCCNLI